MPFVNGTYVASTGYGLSGGKTGGGAEDQAAQLEAFRNRNVKPQAPPTPGPPPQQMIQQMAQAQPEAAVSSLEGAVGGPSMVAPVDTSADAAFTGAGPGVMRPGLPTKKPAPNDGGLRALERRVY